jgi:hypothetical protein
VAPRTATRRSPSPPARRPLAEDSSDDAEEPIDVDATDDASVPDDGTTASSDAALSGAYTRAPR